MLNGKYTPIFPVDDRLYSEQLGLEVVIEGDRFRFYDPMAGEFLLTHTQSIDKADAEARRAMSLEEEMTRLRSELETLRQQIQQTAQAAKLDASDEI